MEADRAAGGVHPAGTPDQTVHEPAPTPRASARERGHDAGPPYEPARAYGAGRIIIHPSPPPPRLCPPWTAPLIPTGRETIMRYRKGERVTLAHTANRTSRWADPGIAPR
jgi:hypothetical protein